MNMLSFGAVTSADACQRVFEQGQYVRTSDGFTGYIYEDSGDPEESRTYQIVICERDEERLVSASEVTLWVPKAGDEVVNAFGETGEFLHRYDVRTSVVKWKEFPLPQICLSASLEPICTD
jgi:hypothetical protein